IRPPGRTSSSTGSSCDAATALRRRDPAAARAVRTRAARPDRGLRGRRARVQSRAARRGGGALRRLPRPRRDGDGDPRRHPRRIRANARRAGGRRIRACVQPRGGEAAAAVRPGDREPLMPRIEDYALIGDLQTAALISREGSVDWLCFPRFDSGACFAALLGDEDNGRWVIEPNAPFRSIHRRYRGDTLILETEWETAAGAVRVIDFMPPRERAPDIVRIVEGIRGSVPMRTELVIRFDYGSIVPWVQRLDGTEARVAIGGPDALCLRTPIAVRGEDMRTIGEFVVDEGSRVPFVLTWFPSHREWPKEIDPEQALRDTCDYWTEFNNRCDY